MVHTIQHDRGKLQPTTLQSIIYVHLKPSTRCIQRSERRCELLQDLVDLCFLCECVLRQSNTLYTTPSVSIVYIPLSLTHTHTHISFSLHPQVQTNRQSELHYEEVQFFSDDTLYQRGIQWSVSSHTLYISHTPSHTQLIHGNYSVQ